MQAAELVWHYTTGQRFVQIVESGEIRPATANVPRSEKPIVWFSAHEVWEPTACKAWQENGAIRRLTREETFEKGLGLVRFGVQKDDLTAWAKLKHKSRMDARTIESLEREGLRQGADPSHWYGTFSPVLRWRWAAVEVWEPAESFEAGHWVPVGKPEPAQ